MTDWQDMIVGDRMTVDEQFAPRVDDSQFTRQEWGLIMTATTFEIESPEDETRARLVADTSELESMMPELEKVADMNPMGGPQEENDSRSLFDSILGILGLGSLSGDNGVDEEKLAEAERLVTAYAEALQTHLESEGRWSEVRSTAVES